MRNGSGSTVQGGDVDVPRLLLVYYMLSKKTLLPLRWDGSTPTGPPSCFPLMAHPHSPLLLLPLPIPGHPPAEELVQVHIHRSQQPPLRIYVVRTWVVLELLPDLWVSRLEEAMELLAWNPFRSRKA